MEVWVLLVTLVTGEVIVGGQYQSEERCWHAGKEQRSFWMHHSPRPLRMDCKIDSIYYPKVQG